MCGEGDPRGNHELEEMVKKWIVALTVALSGLIVSPSLGQPGHINHSPTIPKIKHKPLARMSLRGIERYQIRVINLDRWIIKTHRVHSPEVVNFSRHRLQWTRRELRETRSHLRSSVSSGSGGSHTQGWLCIHSREGAWNAQTGNGYYGGLQMSYGWMGVVSNAALLSPGQQIALADRVARQHGYSYSWMSGQWPNTFPPCAQYF